MTINITPAIGKAYEAYLDEVVDYDFNGKRFQRRNTYPYAENPLSGMVQFAAGYQSANKNYAALEGKYAVLLAVAYGAIVAGGFDDDLPDDAQEVAAGVMKHILTGDDDSISAEKTVFQPLREYLAKFPKVIPE